MTFAVADTVYTYRVAIGVYEVGTPLDALWAVGLAIVAIGAWRPQRRSDVRVDRPWMLTAPITSVLVAVGVLVFASLRSLPLAGGARRRGHAGRRDRPDHRRFLAVADIARVRLEARTDELTGLGNRRLLYETELLRTMGCDVAQGYYFGRPRPGAPMLAEAADAAAIDDLARHQMVKS